MVEVSRGLEGMSEQQRMATLETIFGARAVTAWMAFIEAEARDLVLLNSLKKVISMVMMRR